MARTPSSPSRYACISGAQHGPSAPHIKSELIPYDVGCTRSVHDGGCIGSMLCVPLFVINLLAPRTTYCTIKSGLGPAWLLLACLCGLHAHVPMHAPCCLLPAFLSLAPARSPLSCSCLTPPGDDAPRHPKGTGEMPPPASIWHFNLLHVATPVFKSHALPQTGPLCSRSIIIRQPKQGHTAAAWSSEDAFLISTLPTLPPTCHVMRSPLPLPLSHPFYIDVQAMSRLKDLQEAMVEHVSVANPNLVGVSKSPAVGVGSWCR